MLKGSKLSKETKEKMSKSRKGKKHSEKTKEKMRKSRKERKIKLGYINSLETRNKISKAMIGRYISEKTKKRMSKAKKGKSNWSKGIPWTEARRKAQEFIVRKSSKGWYWCKKNKKPIIKNGKDYTANWHKIRKKVYERDNWTCRECNIHCSGKGTKDKIQCHHIDYNTKNNNLSNLITLCASCHAKTLYRKDDWIKYYQLKIMGD